jgi:hypothetical protein
LWVISKDKQKIVFIDPKGFIHGPAEKIAKIEVQKTLKEIELKLKRKDIELISFIVDGESSSYNKIRGLSGINNKAEFENKRVVFQDDSDCVNKIMSTVIES